MAVVDRTAPGTILLFFVPNAVHDLRLELSLALKLRGGPETAPAVCVGCPTAHTLFCRTPNLGPKIDDIDADAMACEGGRLWVGGEALGSEQGTYRARCRVTVTLRAVHIRRSCRMRGPARGNQTKLIALFESGVQSTRDAIVHPWLRPTTRGGQRGRCRCFTTCYAANLRDPITRDAHGVSFDSHHARWNVV